MPKVLIVATSSKTRGGITSVINAHKRGNQWRKYKCKWIETHRDSNIFTKIIYLISSWILFICIIPTYDIVHFHLSEPISALRKCLFIPIAKLFNKKIIIHFHAFSPETTINGKFKSVYCYIFKNADKIIVLSNYWKEIVNKTFTLSDNQTIVIYNPCTTEILGSKYSPKKHILYAGTINTRKGYSDMIKAFSIIAYKYPEWKLIFAGNGEIENGKNIAKQYKIEKQCHFLGWVNGKTKDKVFKETSIFCLPSYAEGFPMAVLDAWAYGLPVITTPVGGIPDIAINGTNLLLFNPGDISMLSQQMERLIIDIDLRNRIAKESLLLSHKVFNLDSINKRLEELYSNF